MRSRALPIVVTVRSCIADQPTGTRGGGLKGMFIADMIAPCGQDCSICKRALAGTDSCAGCHGPNDNKPEFYAGSMEH